MFHWYDDSGNVQSEGDLMNAKWTLAALAVGMCGLCSCAKNQQPGSTGGAGDWQETFTVKKSDLGATGNNPCLPIQPGRVWKLRNGTDALTITILPDTKVVDGVLTGVLEEREEKDGAL